MAADEWNSNGQRALVVAAPFLKNSVECPAALILSPILSLILDLGHTRVDPTVTCRETMNRILFLLATFLFTDAMATSSEQTYLALGDSYTIGESVAAQERWPVQLVSALRANGRVFKAPVVIARTGWRTDDLKAAIDKAQLKNDFDLVSLSIGVNNQYQGKSVDQYAVDFEDLLLTAITLAKGDKGNVFVVSIPDYGYTPFGQRKQAEITRALDQFNAINARITKKHGVMYFNITDISRLGLEQADLVAADGLHPSGKMYALWVARIASGLAGSGK